MFLPCSFWLVDALLMQGRDDDARALFERLLSVSNDLGLLSEEYDPAEKRQLGNFPQAFTHVGLVNWPTTSRTTRARSTSGRAERGRGRFSDGRSDGREVAPR